jgi:hypothetical protein
LVSEEEHDFPNLKFSDLFMTIFGEKIGQKCFWSKNENKEKNMTQKLFSS